MKYIILSKKDSEYAIQLSEAIWSISIPKSIQHEKNHTTKYYSSPIEYKGSDESYLGFIALPVEEKGFYIHPQSDISILSEFLNNVLTSSEKTSFENVVESSKGSKLNFLQVLQQSSLSNSIKTEEEMDLLEWFGG